MSDSPTSQRPPSRHPRRRSLLALALAAVTLTFAASIVAIGSAAGGGVTVTSAANGKLAETVTVDALGRTLYVLSPETPHHLLCKSAECLRLWPPLTVRSLKAALKDGPGVRGHLTILRRSNGMLQVMLAGLPLYRFSGDRAKGEANGQHIRSFGGTWHVLAGVGNATPSRPSTPSAAPPPAYGY